MSENHKFGVRCILEPCSNDISRLHHLRARYIVDCGCHPIGGIAGVSVCGSKKARQHILSGNLLLSLFAFYRGLHEFLETHIDVTIDICLVVTRICDSDLERCHIVVVAQYTLQSVLHTKYMTIEHAQFEKHGEETSGLFLFLVCQAIQFVDEGGDEHFIESLFDCEGLHEYGLLLQLGESDDRA